MHRIVRSSSRRWLTFQQRTLTGAVLACASLVLAAPSCRPVQPPPALATGERPVTGVAQYDRFFADLGATRDAVDTARDEDNEARQALARRLGLPETAPLDLIGARLRERTSRWASEGLTLELELTGIDDVDASEAPEAGAPEAGAPEAAAEDASASPSATLRTPGREPQRRELRLLEALAQAALSGATVYANMGQARRHVERLEAELAELKGQASSAFPDAAERERVRAKLDEATTFLPELKERARAAGGSADTLISVLEEAANTVPVVPGRRRPAAVPPKAAEPKVAPAPRPAPPPTSPPPAAAGSAPTGGAPKPNATP